MDSVRESLDKCLSYNEKGLIDEILRFIDGEICSRCGRLDTIYDHKCKICRQKDEVIEELNDKLWSDMFDKIFGNI